MNADPLPPIPSPPDHLWRQFRMRGLPFVAFGLTLVATVWLWGRNLANPLVIGQAEGLVVNVTSPISGRLVQPAVCLYQEVKAGDLVALVDASPPQVLSNTVAMIRAEMDAIRADGGFRPADQVRLAQFQLSWLTVRTELATLRPALEFSECEYGRMEQLGAAGIADQTEIEIARRDVNRLRAEVREKTATVDSVEKTLQQLDPAKAAESERIRAALSVANERLQLAESQLQPLHLRAPISGRVTKLTAFPDANLVGGDVVATIASPVVERIVGYVGQPVRLDPKVGTKVEVRSRGAVRESARSQIAYVGPQIEMFNAPLRVRGIGAAQERGLPIVVTVPPNMRLRPGELVDIYLLLN